jgi:hypothetical protein
MFQTLMQSTRLAQHEYINAFGTDGWRDAVCTSVTSNHDYLFPPDPNAPGPEDESEDSPETDAADDVHPAPSAPAAQHAPSTPVGAGLVHPACPEERREPRRARPDCPAPPDRPIQPPPPPPATATTAPPVAPPPAPSSTRPSPAETEAALNVARSIFPARPNTASPQSAAPTPQTCHPERSEGPCLDPTSSTIDETQHPSAAALLPQPTTNPVPAQTAQPNNAPPAAPPPSQIRRQPGAPIREPYTVHFDHTHRLTIDGKPW